MTDLNFIKGSVFNPVITYWQDSAKTTPHNLTGFICQFLIKDDVSDEDAEALYNLSSAGSGLILDAVNGKMSITLTGDQSNTMSKSYYYFEVKITSSGGEKTIIADGRLVRT